MFGKKKIVYQGFDMQEFNKIRELLRGAGIWHDWKVDDRQTHFLAPGKGLGQRSEHPLPVIAEGLEADFLQFKKLVKK